MSERVLGLLAKKADRKERKRQQQALSGDKSGVTQASATTREEPAAPQCLTSVQLDGVSPQVMKGGDSNVVEDAHVLKIALVELEESAEEEACSQTELSTSIMELTCNAALGETGRVVEENR